MPSSLSSEQCAGIVDRLRNNKKHAVLITIPDDDVDASNYARDLAEVLGGGGWIVSGPFAVARGHAVGILIKVHDVSRSHPDARLLMDVLAAVGINARLTQDFCESSDYSYLMV
jgi:hypothetical protein